MSGKNKAIIMSEITVYQGTKDFFDNELPFNDKLEALKKKFRHTDMAYRAGGVEEAGGAEGIWD